MLKCCFNNIELNRMSTAPFATDWQNNSVAQRMGNIISNSSFRMIFGLFIAGVLLISSVKPEFHGDAAEYTLMTIAVAAHGTPEIQAGDVSLAKRVVPEFFWFHEGIEQNFSNGTRLPSGFLQGTDKKIHAIHYFGYSVAAAVPFKIGQMAGLNPMKCFLWVDWICLSILACAAMQYFNSFNRALAATSVFLLTTGIPYWNWASPEFFSASLSLAALFFMAKFRFILSGLLIGLAGMQNPPILALLFIGPAIIGAERTVVDGRIAAGISVLFENWTSIAAGALLGCCLGLLPIYFNLSYFDTWNVIATGATDRRLISFHRLQSYYLDLNQGMVIAIPGILIFVIHQLFKNARVSLILAPVLICSLVLAVPALSTQNWNSGSAGMMRYVAWGSVPFIFLMLLCVPRSGRWPLVGSGIFLTLQSAALVHNSTYHYTEFSPVARWVLQYAPKLYNPEPEIFVDRSTHAEPIIDFDLIYRVGFGSKLKTLYYDGSAKGIFQLCGNKGSPSAESVVRASDDGWTYLNGVIECVGPPIVSTNINMQALQRGEKAQLLDGWSRFEMTSPEDGGVWSLGKASKFVFRGLEGSVSAITIEGTYMEGNVKTRVTVNGTMVGVWHLDRPNRIRLDKVAPTDVLEVLLEHEAPKKPSAQDTRDLAFFMRKVVVSHH